MALNLTLLTQTEEQQQNLTNEVIRLQSNLDAQSTLLWFLFFLFIGIIILMFIYRHYYYKTQEAKKKIVECTDEILTAVRKIQNNQEIKTIWVDDLPQPLQTALLDDRNIIQKIFQKKEVKKWKVRLPMLWTIKGNTIEIKHGAKEGIITTIKNDDKKTQVKHVLSYDKLLYFKNGRNMQPVWLIDINESEPLPVKPAHLAERLYNITEAILMNQGLLGKPKGKFPKILIIIGILVVLGIIAYFALTSGKGTEVTAINETINQTIQTINV